MPFWSWLMHKICQCIISANGGVQNFLYLINLKWVIVLELSFGLDVGCCDAPLEESLLKLYRIAQDKGSFHSGSYAIQKWFSLLGVKRYPSSTIFIYFINYLSSTWLGIGISFDFPKFLIFNQDTRCWSG